MSKDKYNVLFLDIDGVFNSEITRLQRFENYKKLFYDFENTKFLNAITPIDTKCINHLKESCYKNNLHVFITSTWRIIHTLEEIKKTFEYHEANIDIIDMTESSKSRFRGEEIKTWINNFIRQGNYISKYLIVDDSQDFYSFQPQLLIDSNIGFTKENKNYIKKWFNQ